MNVFIGLKFKFAMFFFSCLGIFECTLPRLETSPGNNLINMLFNLFPLNAIHFTEFTQNFGGHVTRGGQLPNA